ncbi:hypothetical protein [Bacillus tropicus]|uniref:hypothetical protein n=1 Tax=Bacillus tropicus TaxID=2026188 RepID=UPI003D1A31A2
MNTYTSISKKIAKQFDTYLIEHDIFTHEIHVSKNEIEVHLETTESFHVFSLYIYDNIQEVDVTRCFLPKELQGNGIIKHLISIAFNVAKEHGYRTIVSQLVNHFRDSLLGRGAIKILGEPDAVEIVDNTRL